MTHRANPDGFTTLQSLIWPEQGICTERDLYLRPDKGVGLSESRREVYLGREGFVSFDTWFNLFNIGKWIGHCGLETLYLTLNGSGEMQVTVLLASSHRSWQRMEEMVELTPGAPVRLNLSAMFADTPDDGVIFFEVQALTPGGVLQGADWQTQDAPRRLPDLMLAITTFKREAAVRNTVTRFESYISNSPLKDHIRLTVVDNGQSAGLAESPHVTVIDNENLGGAGGFSRGLLAARDTGASHCLFMDDDASIHMESLDRTWRFLSYATDPATAVAGAMINATHRWSIWENGAQFNGNCIPLHMGTDLRQPDQVHNMECTTTGPAPDNLYGGWWYFAFPVDRAEHQPFPFFVRGDDVSFSLVHAFNIVRLNGVVSFQDSFTDKESPLTWYLDLRSHLAHHLALPSMNIGALRTLKIAIWFFLRNLPRMHYDTLAAINLALEDVLKGPGFFDEQADMGQRRADIKALTQDEAWGPVPADLPGDSWQARPRNPLLKGLMKLTLNGHLLPFFRLFGARVTLPAEDRGSLQWVWGAARITYLSANRRQAYTVHHSKLKFLRQGLRFARLSLRFLSAFKTLQQEWQAGYAPLTSETYWRDKLQIKTMKQTAEQAESERQTA